MSGLVLVTLEQGLIFGILAMGVYITYKILDFPDLSVEGSFPLGAFVFAKFSVMGWNPILATLLAFAAGGLVGLFTYTLNIKFKIKPILAGILSMTFMYSVVLRVNDTSNVSVINNPKIYDRFGNVITLIIIVLLAKLLLDMFLKTELGYLLIATGDNEGFVRSLGQNEEKLKLIGLTLSNALVGLSGALMAQSLGFADISIKNGIIVTALASIIIGDALFPNAGIIKNTTRAIYGAIIYKAIGSIAIRIGLKPNDLQAVSATIVILFLAQANLGIQDLFKSKQKHKKNIEAETNKEERKEERNLAKVVILEEGSKC